MRPPEIVHVEAPTRAQWKPFAIGVAVGVGVMGAAGVGLWLAKRK